MEWRIIKANDDTERLHLNRVLAEIRAEIDGIGGGGAWGSITGTLSAQTDLQSALNAKLTALTPITGATKTKITYNANGLVTAGADATTADIADSSNKRYVTDAQLVVVGNTSGTNSGDQTITLTGHVTGSGTGSFATTIGAGTVTEAMQVLADNTTNNASTSAHGYLKKLSNIATEFMNGTGNWATPAGAGGPWSQVDDYVVSGGAVTSFNIGSLDLATDQFYFGAFAFNNATGSNSSINLYYNADSTSTNYYRQTFNAINTSLSGSRANDYFWVTIPANETVTGWFTMQRDIDGRTRCYVRMNYGAVSSIELRSLEHGWTSTANPTQINWLASVANSISNDSYVRLYKMVFT